MHFIISYHSIITISLYAYHIIICLFVCHKCPTQLPGTIGAVYHTMTAYINIVIPLVRLLWVTGRARVVMHWVQGYGASCGACVIVFEIYPRIHLCLFSDRLANVENWLWFQGLGNRRDRGGLAARMDIIALDKEDNLPLISRRI
jgi:hypothetical protein